MNYNNRFDRLRNRFKTRDDLKNEIKKDIKKDYIKDKIERFEEVTKLVDMFKDTYKRESMEILEKLENINNNNNLELEIPKMDSTKLIVKYIENALSKL
uniref:Uncharacterized protein n=1 Tax=viral metagenome TaxID=1070528 RepID=A0A6C0JHH6_9ZZZZ